MDVTLEDEDSTRIAEPFRDLKFIYFVMLTAEMAVEVHGAQPLPPGKSICDIYEIISCCRDYEDIAVFLIHRWLHRIPIWVQTMCHPCYADFVAVHWQDDL